MNLDKFNKEPRVQEEGCLKRKNNESGSSYLINSKENNCVSYHLTYDFLVRVFIVCWFKTCCIRTQNMSKKWKNLVIFHEVNNWKNKYFTHQYSIFFS